MENSFIFKILIKKKIKENVTSIHFHLTLYRKIIIEI
jgi:hypothetical protein